MLINTSANISISQFVLGGVGRVEVGDPAVHLDVVLVLDDAELDGGGVQPGREEAGVGRLALADRAQGALLIKKERDLHNYTKHHVW